MNKLYGYTVLRDTDSEKPWAIVRIEVQYTENPGKATQYIHVVDYHDSRSIAQYYATMLNEERYTEDKVQELIKSGGK